MSWPQLQVELSKLERHDWIYAPVGDLDLG